MGFIDYILKTDAAQKVVGKAVSNVIEKAASSRTVSSKGIKRYTVDLTNQSNQGYSRRKPDSGIPFDVLRKFSTSHHITRACINARKRQLAGMEWDIVPLDDTVDPKSVQKDIDEVKAFFTQIGGTSNHYRKFVNKVTEDLLCLDAVAIYRQRTIGGDLQYLVPVDASTIRLRVDQSGNTPEPPEIAYRQVIRGQVTAEMTTAEMLYEMMNPRTNSPYGLAPLESLMLIVSSALKADSYNLAYLTEGNVPEGFYRVPEEWNQDTIRDFQEYWDALMEGDEAAMRKIRFMPGGQGSGYEATKKPSDMAWEKFNDWLMKVTCALFDIPPTEIGFPPTQGLGGKGFGESQEEVNDRRGLQPLCNFFAEMWDNVIHNDLGFESLRFQYLGLDDKDDLARAETNANLINTAQRTPNEIRQEEGLLPLPGGDDLLFAGNVTVMGKDVAEPVGQDSSVAVDTATDAERANAANPETAAPTDKSIAADFLKFRKMATQRIKAGKKPRPFTSDIIPAEALSEMNDRLQKADLAEARKIFDEFTEENNLRLIAAAVELRQELAKLG